ncbi:MAG TPA: vitamin K epoxide reductase family protein [Actinomycetes bacterium]
MAVVSRTPQSGRAAAPEPEAPPTSGGRGWWAAVLVAGLAGVVFTGIQIVEKIAISDQPSTVLSCDINSVVSCSSVLTAWQSSVLGPPNALVGAVLFALLASGGLAGVLGSRASRSYLLTLWGLAVFFLGFASWFMYQTAFRIGALCIWCTGIVTAVVVISAALTRLNHRRRTLGEGSAGRALDLVVHSNGDLIVWAGWWIVLAVLVWAGLAG